MSYESNAGTYYVPLTCGVATLSGTNTSSNKNTYYVGKSANDFILWGQPDHYNHVQSNSGSQYYFYQCGVSSVPFDVNTNAGTHYYYSSSFNCVPFCQGISIVLNIRSVAWVGDSQTDRSSGTDVGAVSINTNSYASWVRILTKDTFETIKNLSRNDYDYGYSGETAAQILARMPDINSSMADTLLIQVGVNSITGGRGVDGTVEDIVAIWDSGLGAGKQVVGVEIFPHSLIPINDQIDSVNDRLELEASSRGILFIRFDNTLRIGDDDGGLAKPEYLEDITHYNQVGCHAIAIQVSEQLTPYITTSSPFPPQGDSSIISSNYFWESGFTGGLPNGWTLITSTATCLYERIAADDGGPDWVQVTISNNDTSLSWLRSYITTGFNIGDIIYSVTEIQKVSGSINVLDLLLYYYNITTTTSNYSPNTETTIVPTFSGAFVTPPHPVPLGTTQLRQQIQFKGNGIFKFRKAAIIKQ